MECFLWDCVQILEDTLANVTMDFNELQAAAEQLAERLAQRCAQEDALKQTIDQADAAVIALKEQQEKARVEAQAVELARQTEEAEVKNAHAQLNFQVENVLAQVQSVVRFGGALSLVDSLGSFSMDYNLMLQVQPTMYLSKRVYGENVQEVQINGENWNYEVCNVMKQAAVQLDAAAASEKTVVEVINQLLAGQNVSEVKHDDSHLSSAMLHQLERLTDFVSDTRASRNAVVCPFVFGTCIVRKLDLCAHLRQCHCHCDFYMRLGFLNHNTGHQDLNGVSCDVGGSGIWIGRRC